MHVLVTGASGFVGSAVVAELKSNGHEVTGLARSDEAAALVDGLGARVHRGDLTDLEVLGRAAAAADGVIHCGFNHDFSKFADNCAQDRRVVGALGRAIEGTARPLVVTSSIGILAPGRMGTEDDASPKPSLNPRAATEEAVDEVRGRGVNASIVRLPPSVHGTGDHAFVPGLIALARDVPRRRRGRDRVPAHRRGHWPQARRTRVKSDRCGRRRLLRLVRALRQHGRARLE